MKYDDILIVNPNSLVALGLVWSDGSGPACQHHISLRGVFTILQRVTRK